MSRIFVMRRKPQYAITVADGLSAKRKK